MDYAWVLHLWKIDENTFATLHRCLQGGTGAEFAAKLFKYSSVHLYLIFVWAIVMTEYAGTYKL